MALALAGLAGCQSSLTLPFRCCVCFRLVEGAFVVSSVGRPVGRLVGRCVSEFVGRSVNWLVRRCGGLFVGRLARWLVDSLVLWFVVAVALSASSIIVERGFLLFCAVLFSVSILFGFMRSSCSLCALYRVLDPPHAIQRLHVSSHFLAFVFRLRVKRRRAMSH